jgi:hypothetical protein
MNITGNSSKVFVESLTMKHLPKIIKGLNMDTCYTCGKTVKVEDVSFKECIVMVDGKHISLFNHKTCNPEILTISKGWKCNECKTINQYNRVKCYYCGTNSKKRVKK